MSDPFQTPMLEQAPGEPPPLPNSAEGVRANDGCLTGIPRIMAAICVAVFEFAAPAALFMFNFEQVVFNPSTYKQALNRMDFYDQLPTLVAGAIVDSVAQNPENNAALARVPKSDIQAIATDLVTHEWAQEQTESAIDQLFTWLDADGTTLSVKISMAGIKERLGGPEGTSAALKIVNSWTPCNDIQILSAAAVVASGDMSGLPTCRLPDDMMPAVTPYFSEVVKQGAKTVPDTIDLAAPNGISPSIAPEDDPRPQLKLFRGIARFSPIFPVLLLMIITALAVRSSKDLSLWWGVSLLGAGIIGGLIALAMLPFSASFTRGFLEGSREMATSMQDVVSGVFNYVFQTAGVWIGAESALLVGAGIVLLILRYVVWREQKPAPLSYEPMV